MPAPTSYSEGIFRDYLVGVLDELAGIVGWDSGSPPVVEACSDALLELGISDISTVTKPRDVLGLRALGRRAIWRAVVQAVSARYDITASEGTFSRSKIQAMALESLKLAENDCLQFSPAYAVQVVRVSRPQDPYAVLPDEQRVP
jgi:hypothetical protein